MNQPSQFRLWIIYVAMFLVAAECALIAYVKSRTTEIGGRGFLALLVVPALALFSVSGRKVQMAILLTFAVALFELFTWPADESASLDIQFAVPAAVVMSAAVWWAIRRIGR